MFDPDSIGRPLTDNSGAWSGINAFRVEESDALTAFGSAQAGAQALIRYTFVAGSSCAVAGWPRYLSTINPAEQPAGSTVSNTPPGVSTNDTQLWVCPP